MLADDMQKAKTLCKWKQRLRRLFGSVRVESVSDDMGGNGGAQMGKDVRVEAVVDLAELEPSDVNVELYFGLLDEDGQLNAGQAVVMEQVGQEGDHTVKYAVDMPCRASGMTGYTVRVLPCHELVTNVREMAMIRWA